MPKKPNKPNGFAMFAQELCRKSAGKLTIQQAFAQAGKLWPGMTPGERQPYNEEAKQKKGNPLSAGGAKLDSWGNCLETATKQKNEEEDKERNVKRNIETTVRNSVKRGGKRVGQ